MLSLILLAGIWSSSCIMTQSNMNQGYLIETYSIAESGDYELKREWHQDPLCSAKISEESETGSLKLGKKLSGMFINGDSYEADFSSEMGKDLGAVQVNAGKLKVARGMKNSTMRNTMLGLFEYLKQ